MQSIFDQISNTRKEQCWSQSELAVYAGVSLATLQNIEAGNANPTLEVIQKITQALSMTFAIQDLPFESENGIFLGLPLTSKIVHRRIPSQKKLIKFIRNTFTVFEALNERERDAFMALLLAVKTDFGLTFKKLNVPASLDVQFKDLSLKGRWIKLRRIALEQLVKYL